MKLTLDAIPALFDAYGDQSCGEGVSQRAHMLQSADLAVAANAPDALIAAALLHDIGHFEHPPKRREHAARRDLAHEAVTPRALATLFGPDVWAPAALHVAAKRYLCAVGSDYLDRLSEASRTSLALQGGVFSAAQVVRFERSAHAAAAVRLRRFDDAAKRPDAPANPLSRYLPLLERLARTRADSARRPAALDSPSPADM